MTPVTPTSPSPLMVPLALSDIAVSWAGSGARDDDFCFGSEDGRLLFTTVEGRKVGEFTAVQDHPEAVNGVAFIGATIAVSTRQNITLWTLPRPGSQQAQRAVIPCGAHGVLGTAKGWFVAPLGPTGLLRLLPNRKDLQEVKVFRAKRQAFYYYRVISLHSFGQAEVLVCAARSGGILATETLLQEGVKGTICSRSLPGLDVVDVCSLGTDALPPAVAGLGRDGTVVLSRDILHDPSPTTLRFASIDGTAYRVFSSRGTVLVLTSAGLYVLESLAERFLAGERMAQEMTPVRGLPLEAVDANLCGERWMLIVLPDGILRLDIDGLRGREPENDILPRAQLIRPSTASPSWTAKDTPAEACEVGG